MKTVSGAKTSRAGIALMECLIYIGVFSVILNLSYAAFGRFSLQSKRLRQSTADIAKCMHVGEIWRADIRAATGEIKVEKGANQTMRIPQRDGAIVYIFAEQTVSRGKGNGDLIPLLTQVKLSEMQDDLRKNVKAWRWQLELNGRDPKAKIRPVFRFQAVVPSLEE